MAMRRGLDYVDYDGHILGGVTTQLADHAAAKKSMSKSNGYRQVGHRSDLRSLALMLQVNSDARQRQDAGRDFHSMSG
jgi:hypothetical protein